MLVAIATKHSIQADFRALRRAESARQVLQKTVDNFFQAASIVLLKHAFCRTAQYPGEYFLSAM